MLGNESAKQYRISRFLRNSKPFHGRPENPGRRHEAEEVVNRFKDIAKTQYVLSYWIAGIYAALGDEEKAFAELEKSFAAHAFYLHRLKVDPYWDPLRDDPRFKDLLRRMGLPQ